MNLEHIKYFTSVARSGSANAAAKALGVNHSTVIRCIGQLEDSLGVQLFIRNANGFQLSHSGQALLQDAAQIEASAQQFIRRAKGFVAKPQGKLSISLPENALLNLAPILAKFSSTFPDIELRLDSSAELSNLNNLETDIAIRLSNAPPEHLIGTQLGVCEFGVFAGKQYLSQFSELPSPQQCQWALWQGSMSSNLPEAHHPDRLLEQERLGSCILRSSHVSDILACIEQNMAVGLLSYPVAKQRGLKHLPFDDLIRKHRLDKAEVWLLRHPDLMHSEPVKAFVEFIKNEDKNWMNTQL